MPKKMGRPVSENPKDKTIKVRMDKQSLEMLDDCSKGLNTSRSEIVRKGIKRIYDDMKNE